MDKTILKEKASIPLTNTDLEVYLGKDVQNHIVKYSDLANYNSIEDLLPTDKSYKIILIETKLNSGHWVCICRYNNIIEVFNSYGCKPSVNDFCHVKKLTNFLLQQIEPYLNNLLNKAIKQFKVIYNKFKFQKVSNYINTCGRWCVLRLLMMLEHNMDLEHFIDFIKLSAKEKQLTRKMSYIIVGIYG